MALPSDEDRARTFTKGVDRISKRWGQQSLSELRESHIDGPTRRSLAQLALGCTGLLDNHGAGHCLAALISLDPEAQLELDPSQVDSHGDLPPNFTEETKEVVLDWINTVSDGLEALYKPEDGRSPSNAALSNPTITIKLPRGGNAPTSPGPTRGTQDGASGAKPRSNRE